MFNCIFFFFSSRRRHTRLTGDWSSDVCSSDLSCCRLSATGPSRRAACRGSRCHANSSAELRSEERRVGKECRYRWSAYHYKKKNKRKISKHATSAQPLRTAPIGHSIEKR